MPLLLALALVALLAVPAMSLAAQPTVNLGTTASYAVLAGSTITNTGATTVTGDIGLSPGTAFTGQASVTVDGAVNINNAAASQAQLDLVTAYDDAAGRTPVTSIPAELGGTTLKPGVYASAAGTFLITGTLTLDAEGDPDAVFIFQMGSSLTTMTDSRVNLINGARFCRVFWQVGSSATLGTNSQFVGHIFALTSITAQTGATVQGQLMARNGAVTLDTNTITNGPCETSPTPTPTPTVTPTPTPTVTPTPTPTVTPTPTPTVTPTPTPTVTPTPTPTVTPTPTPTVTPTPTTPKVTLALLGLTNGAEKLGGIVAARGKVTPTSLSGSLVKITLQTRRGGTWVTVKSVKRTIRANGVYFWKYLPPRSGAYRMRTTIAQTPTSTSATTQWHRFKVVRRVVVPDFNG